MSSENNIVPLETHHRWGKGKRKQKQRRKPELSPYTRKALVLSETIRDIRNDKNLETWQKVFGESAVWTTFFLASAGLIIYSCLQSQSPTLRPLRDTKANLARYGGILSGGLVLGFVTPAAPLLGLIFISLGIAYGIMPDKFK